MSSKFYFRKEVKYIQLGNKDRDIYPEFLFTVVDTVIHPEYTSFSSYNDIALLKMDKK